MEQICARLIGGRYEISRKVGENGAVAVYLGRDTTSDKAVVVKEFFSSKLMERGEDFSVDVKGGCEVQYKSLSIDYEELWSYLMKLPEDLPLVRPTDVFWFENTVYCIEESCRRETLEDYLARAGESISWAKLKRMISPVVKLLSKIHADGIYHRGISPQTLCVTDNEKLIITEFLIPPARTAESELESLLYFGYSAPEQYSSNSWQGSWSDVYSLAAVCYRALTGVTAVEWRQRKGESELVPAAKLNDSIPPNVSEALSKALAVELRDRYRTIEEFWCDLLEIKSESTVTYQLPIQKRTDDMVQTLPAKNALPFGSMPTVIAAIALVCAVAIFALAISYRLIDIYLVPPVQQEVSSSSENSEPAQESSSSETSEPELLTPRLVGMNIEDILLDPFYTNLFSFDIERVFSDSQVAGAVVAQQPKAGEEPPSSSAIFLWISKGTERIEMPDLIGLDADEAVHRLETSEIEYSVELVEEAADGEHKDAKNGSVIGTSIKAGVTVYRNSDTVVVYVLDRKSSTEGDGEVVVYNPFIDGGTTSVPPRVEQDWSDSKKPASNLSGESSK